jgi:hypothetical protein
LVAEKFYSPFAVFLEVSSEKLRTLGLKLVVWKTREEVAARH